jgi:hypothetical protein
MFLYRGSIAPVRDNSHHGCYRNFVILCRDFMPVTRVQIPGFSLPEYNSAIIYRLRNRVARHFRIRFSELQSADSYNGWNLSTGLRPVSLSS